MMLYRWRSSGVGLHLHRFSSARAGKVVSMPTIDEDWNGRDDFLLVIMTHRSSTDHRACRQKQQWPRQLLPISTTHSGPRELLR